MKRERALQIALAVCQKLNRPSPEKMAILARGTGISADELHFFFDMVNLTEEEWIEAEMDYQEHLMSKAYLG